MRVLQRRCGSSKICLIRLIFLRYRTYVDVTTGKKRWQDHQVIFALPVGVYIFSFLHDIRLEAAASVGLLTVSGLLAAFLAGGMLQMSQRSMDWADADQSQSRHTSFMPTPWRSLPQIRRALASCNSCSDLFRCRKRQFKLVAWHFLGHQSLPCSSYDAYSCDGDDPCICA